jgi:hypothetical protein
MCRKEMTFITLALTLLSLLLATTPLWAGAFEERSSQETYARLQIKRPMVLAKGVFEFGLGYDFRPYFEYFDADGNRQDLETSDSQSAVGKQSFFNMFFRYGVSSNLTLEAAIPMRLELFRIRNVSEYEDSPLYGEEDFSTNEGNVSFANDNVEQKISGLGDVKLGFAWQLYHKNDPMRSAGLKVIYKTTSGSDAPTDSNGETSLLLGSGQADVTPIFIFKQQYAALAAQAEAGYNFRLANNVQYITTENGGTGWINPGDEVLLNGALMFQSFDFVSLEFNLHYKYRGKSKIGSSRTQYYSMTDILTDPDLAQIRAKLFRDDGRVFDSDGHGISLEPKVMFQLGNNMDVVGRVDVPVMGANTLFWGNLEPLGNTYSLNVFFRY